MRALNFPIPRAAPAPGASNWTAVYPNPADFPFNYHYLLANAVPSGAIGAAPSGPAVSVAIVGAGAAGMTVARELVRAGFNVAIYEATSRICGRHYTFPSPTTRTGMELGAMRFPYFGQHNGPAAGSQNCLLDYYLTMEAGKAGNVAQTSPFPNPGAAPGGTGIYMNNGLGPVDEFPSPQMIIWPYSNVSPNFPNDQHLAPVGQIVYDFVDDFTTAVGNVYGTPQWPAMWKKICDHYDKMSFSDLVFAPRVAANDYQNDGWLGGLGLNDVQSEIFYTIGSGDGSWGAFYDVSALWFIRCTMFGFSSNLQAVFGLSNATTIPGYGASYLDSGGNSLPAPQFSGIQSLAEWLFYGLGPGMNDSLADIMNDNPVATSPVNLYTQRPVTTIARQANGSIAVTDATGATVVYNHVVVTAPIWATDMSIDFQGFTPSQLPFTSGVARAEQHIIASTKVFFPLKQPYWQVSKIPQILVTDTFVQDAYGVQWSPGDPGALLASYTWADDSVKLDPYSTNTQDPASADNAALAQMVLAELDRITTSTLGVAISQYVDAENPVVWRWGAAAGFNGCAKLYRQRNWVLNHSLLAYNQNLSASSHLYFAGESYSVEGGWTEPALRLAIDAVIRIIQNSGGRFNGGFNVANDYPVFPDWKIDEKYPPPSAAGRRGAP
ncbi:MAG: flavin monoamine oxidase family protein [Gemmatimonadota bacterium]